MNVPALRPIPWSIACCLCGYRAALLLYPRDSRERFGTELLEIVADRLAHIHSMGGHWAVCRAWPLLWLDAADSLGAEYLDFLSGYDRALINGSLACLLVAAVVWTLTVLVSYFNQMWLLPITDWSTPLTMTLAFGMPPAALAVSCVSLSVADTGSAVPRATCYASAIMTVGAWGDLLAHLYALKT